MTLGDDAADGIVDDGVAGDGTPDDGAVGVVIAGVGAAAVPVDFGAAVFGRSAAGGGIVRTMPAPADGAGTASPGTSSLDAPAGVATGVGKTFEGGASCSASSCSTGDDPLVAKPALGAGNA